MRRLLVRPTNWNNPIDCVSRGSITGGSQADARARTPPRLGGLGLAGIQSGYLEAAAAGRLRPVSAAAPTPAAEILTKSRRFRPDWRPSIASSFTVLRIEGKDEPDTRRVVGNIAGRSGPSQEPDYLSIHTRAMVGEPYPTMPRRTPPPTFLRYGWERTKMVPQGIHNLRTWSYSRSTIRLAIARCSARSGACLSFTVNSSMIGSLTRKKFFVDLLCMNTYVRSSRPTACPDWKPQAIPAHFPST